jgi:hypothetical protein
MGCKGFVWVCLIYCNIFWGVAFYATLEPMNPELKDPLPETPADKCITAFGGVRALARALERNPSSVVRWRKPKDEGGSNGAVPSALQGRILAIAQARGLSLTAEDLILRTASDWRLDD